MDFNPDRAFEARFLHSPDTFSALMQAANEIDAAFKDIAPRRTGNMVRSAHAEMSQGREGWECQYVVPVENERGTQYGKFVEFGTKKMRAQHNLKHALEIVQAKNGSDQ